MYSILAGFMIGIGAIVNLKVGGIVGALLFAIGLATIVQFKLELFTGKVGLFAENLIDLNGLIRIWLGNFTGTFAAALLIIGTTGFEALSGQAAAIIDVRMANDFMTNFIYGIFCGVLMFVAVTGFSKDRNFLFVFIPVAVFILCGFNHCVADMVYLWLGAESLEEFLVLIPTTLGNCVGAIGFNYLLVSSKRSV